MTITTIPLNQLMSMTPQERADMILDFRTRPRNGELEFLDDSINRMEVRYEMSSETMKQKLRSHEIRETADIGAWLMLLKARDGLAK